MLPGPRSSQYFASLFRGGFADNASEPFELEATAAEARPRAPEPCPRVPFAPRAPHLLVASASWGKRAGLGVSGDKEGAARPRRMGER